MFLVNDIIKKIKEINMAADNIKLDLPILLTER